MELRAHSGRAHEVEADWLIVPTWEDGVSAAAAEANRVLAGLLDRMRQSGDLSGKMAETTPLYHAAGFRSERLLIVGLGKRSEANRGVFFKVGVAAGKFVSQKPRHTIAACVPGGEDGVLLADVLPALSAGLIRGFRGPGIRQNQPKRYVPEAAVFLLPGAASIDAAAPLLFRGQVEGEAVQRASDLVNEPPCDKYPEELARRVADAASTAGVQWEILEESRLRAERMGSLLGVAQGSARPPRVVVLRYNRGNAMPTVGLVGKGVTFDSGGLSLKSNEQMLDMKCDMAGAAAVFAAMIAVAQLRLPVNLLGILALVENLPSGTAMKLGDVLKARSGKTIEVLNTDAEGRLILADALTYAIDLGAERLIDLATLTGACMIALGTEVAGLMTNHHPWADEVQAAIQSAGERAWPLPMYADYAELLKSQVADIKNVGGKYGGAITAAKFLENFVGQTPWVHLDIAGPAFATEENPARDAGGTGYMVRSLIELAHRL